MKIFHSCLDFANNHLHWSLINRCRKGSAEMLVNFDNFWPSDLLSMSSQETNLLEDGDAPTNYQICGKEIPRGYWVGRLPCYSFSIPLTSILEKIINWSF